MGTFPRQLARLALCLCLAVLGACGTQSAQVLQYEKEMVVGIAGGFACDNPELEAVGALVRQDQEAFCSGALIAEDTVLTAAHCLEGEDLNHLSYRIGTEPRTAVSYPIASGTPHPRYAVDKRGPYDMALLHLRAPVLGVTPLPYRKASLPVYFRGQLTFVGFGDDNGAARTGAGIKRCLRLYISRVNELTFENSTRGHDTCHGDSGGPVLDYRDGRREIVGIITSGDGLCQRFGLSARVDVAADWIARTASPPHGGTGPL